MKLKPGPNRKGRINVKNTRGMAFCGLGAFVGVGKTQRAHVYTATSVTDVTPETPSKIDPKRLARELEVDMCAVNGGRFWTMDEMDFQGGDIVDFHGVGMTWAGDMTGAEMMAQMADAYAPSLIYRNTDWIYYAGKPVYLLREPGGAVWVMQEFTKDVDPSLAVESLDQVGSKLKNSAERLDVRDQGSRKTLSLDTGRAGGWAAILRDELHCTYQGCGYGADASANFVP